jgi:DNA-binding NarL/FixJ family response regulator
MTNLIHDQVALNLQLSRELAAVKKELLFLGKEKVKRVAELIKANQEKANLADELIIINRELSYLQKKLGIEQDSEVHDIEIQSSSFLDSCAALTYREKEVCALLVEGLKSTEIAQKLEIAAVTVKLHKSRVMHKKNMNSVVQLSRNCVAIVKSGCKHQDHEQTPKRIEAAKQKK